MPFKTPLILKAERRKNEYSLVHGLVYTANDMKIFVVPAGFKTDFATIPKCFRWFIDDNGAGIRDAAVLHDFLYSTRSRLHQNVSRRKADKYLIEAMKALGAPWYKRHIVYLAVRAAGWAYFKKEGNE